METQGNHDLNDCGLCFRNNEGQKTFENFFEVFKDKLSAQNYISRQYITQEWQRHI